MAPARRATTQCSTIERSLARLGGDPALFVEIVGLFLEDSPILLERAQRGLRDQNLAELERTAHSLKGLSVTFNAHALSAAALSVEQHARERDLERAAACFADLEHELERLQGVLKRFQQSAAHQRPADGHSSG